MTNIGFEEMVSQFEEDLIIGVEYFYMSQITSVMATTLRRLNIVNINDGIVDAFKYAICNFYFGGCEPEFKSDDAMVAWNEFKAENLLFAPNNVTNKWNNRNPYKDKSRPYLQWTYTL